MVTVSVPPCTTPSIVFPSACLGAHMHIVSARSFVVMSERVVVVQDGGILWSTAVANTATNSRGRHRSWIVDSWLPIALIQHESRCGIVAGRGSQTPKSSSISLLPCNAFLCGHLYSAHTFDASKGWWFKLALRRCAWC